MCYVNGNLVVTTRPFGKPTWKTKVYDERGRLLTEWEQCHWQPSTSMMGYEIDGRDYLLVGCKVCEMIRGYEFPQIKCKILGKGISPGCMCKGPDNTILVFEQKSIKQFRYSEGQFRLMEQVHLVREFSVGFRDVSGLCFSDNSGLVIVLHYDRKTLTGFHFTSGQVAWQHTAIIFGCSSQVLTDFRHILTLPDGRVCVFTNKESSVLDTTDGTILYMLHDFAEVNLISAVATCFNGNQQKLAIQHNGSRTRVYEVSFQSPNLFCNFPLKDIITDDENTEANV